MAQKIFALDLETSGVNVFKDDIWMMGVSDGKKLNIHHDCYGNCISYIKKYKDVLQDNNVMKIIHNAAFDSSFIEMKTGVKIRNVWDTMLCETVIQGVVMTEDEQKKNPALAKKHSSKLLHVLPRYGFPTPNKDITKQFINRPKGRPFTTEEIEYLKLDVQYLPAIQKAQEYLLNRDGLLEVALMENLNVERVAEAKVYGIGWSGKIWNEVAEDNEREFHKRVAALPKSVSNWNSPKQVKDYFKSIGIHIESFKDLDDVYIKTKNKLLGDFIYARDLHKSVTSYGRNWFEEGFCDTDGRIRASIQQIINSGRYSMYNPNLQQLPGEGKSNPKRLYTLKLIAKQYGGKGKIQPQHRRAFIPRKGYKFVIGDFSGQEMGIMAAASGEDLWIDAMLRGDDVHSVTASLLYAAEWARTSTRKCMFPKKCNCPEHSNLRSPTKILNFMLAYGGGQQKFSWITGVDEKTAKKIIAAYRKIIPRLTMWLNVNGRESIKTGVSYSADPYKRLRRLNAEEDWKVNNQGKNNPIQSAGANMIKLAMNSVPREYYIPLVIHDEIILEVPNAKAKTAAKMLKKVMEDSAAYITGIKGLIKVEPRIADNLMKE